MKDINKLEKICEHISKRELLASKAERDSIKYKQVEYLQDKIGQIFDGIISGITEWGIYIELTESKCEGMAKYGYRFKFDLDNQCIINSIGEIKRLGDPIQVTVISVDLEKKQINFDII